MSEKLDLTSIPCPQNISKILIKLEIMDCGDLLDIIIDDGEPFENVKLALMQEGHQILKTEKCSGNTWHLTLKKT